MAEKGRKARVDTFLKPGRLQCKKGILKFINSHYTEVFSFKYYKSINDDFCGFPNDRASDLCDTAFESRVEKAE